MVMSYGTLLKPKKDQCREFSVGQSVKINASFPISYRLLSPI